MIAFWFVMSFLLFIPLGIVFIMLLLWLIGAERKEQLKFIPLVIMFIMLFLWLIGLEVKR